MYKVVVFVENGNVKVLTSDAALAVLVIDRNTGRTRARLTAEGQDASAEAIASGIPHVAPQRVDALFAEVGSQLRELSRTAELGVRERVQLANLAQGWFCADSDGPVA